MTADERRLKLLLAKGLGGDPIAYRQFLSETCLLLRRYVERQLRKLGRSPIDAEDVVQEALLAVHSRLHTYEQEVPVTAWVHAIARYKLIDFLRSTNARAYDLPLSEVEEFLGDDTARFETTIAVRKIITSLPQRLRIPIALMKLEGLSVAETSARTGLSEATVKINVHRGLKAMARMFD